MGAGHTPANRDEPDVKPDDNGIHGAVDGALDDLVTLLHEPINQEAKCQDGKIQCRVVVVHVGDTRHNNKGEIVKEPASHGVKSRVVNLVNIVLVEFFETTLPSQDVPNNDEANNTERYSRAPVDKGVTEEEILDDVVVPTTHSETNMQDRPLPPLGGKVVLLIGVGDQSVVGGHHRDIEMDEVVEEGRLV